MFSNANIIPRFGCFPPSSVFSKCFIFGAFHTILDTQIKLGGWGGLERPNSHLSFSIAQVFNLLISWGLGVFFWIAQGGPLCPLGTASALRAGQLSSVRTVSKWKRKDTFFLIFLGRWAMVQERNHFFIPYVDLLLPKFGVFFPAVFLVDFWLNG